MKIAYDTTYLIHLVKHLLRFRSKASQLEDLAPDLILRFLRFANIPLPLCTNERVDEGMSLFDKIWLPTISELENLSEMATNQLSVLALRSYLGILGHILPSNTKKNQLRQALWTARGLTILHGRRANPNTFKSFNMGSKATLWHPLGS